MSFLSGPECSTGANPLAQFTKHVQDDKTLQHDRLRGSGSGPVHEGFRTQRDGSSQDHAMNEFLHGGQIPEGPALGVFHRDEVRRDLDGYRTRPGPVPGAGWAAEFQPEQQVEPGFNAWVGKQNGVAHTGFSSAEFHKFDRLQDNRTSHASIPPAHAAYSLNSFQRPMGMGMMTASYRPLSTIHQTNSQPQQSKDKGRMVELDDSKWEEQFSKLEQSSQAPDQREEQGWEALKAELDQMDRSASADATETLLGDFESIWRGIEAESKTNRTLHADQYGQALGGDEEEWIDADPSMTDLFESFNAESSHMRPASPYIFEQDNPYLSSNTIRDPYTEGMRILQEGGNLSLAALAFEAAVQKNPDHADAWQALGHAQAQNEKEIPAIRAFNECLEVDPENLPALMGLAISHTNEGYESSAYRTLERWVSVKYPSLIPASSSDTPQAEGEPFGFTDRLALHQRVTDLFLRAAQLSPAGPNLDPDVQVGLGVLFYGANEFDKAVDCFSAALASSEEGITNRGGRGGQQHLLWNRLGATLANSSRSEEAIDAYERALELEPNFVRARYNLAVSCTNMMLYEQAAQHLLGALSMHRVVERQKMEMVNEFVSASNGGSQSSVGGGNLEGGYDGIEGHVDPVRLAEVNQSTNLLETLRRVFANMGRRDLADKVEVGMDVEPFRSEFDF